MGVIIFETALWKYPSCLPSGKSHVITKPKEMKCYFFLLAVLLTFTGRAQSEQEMRVLGNQLLLGDVPISVGMAKDLSMAKSSEAYLSFKRASTIRTWNVVWWIFGGYEIIAGGASLAGGNSIGAADVAIGGVLIGITPYRENKRKLYITQGVSAFNKSLKKEQQ